MKDRLTTLLKEVEKIREKDWGDLSYYEEHERGVPKGYKQALDDVIILIKKHMESEE